MNIDMIGPAIVMGLAAIGSSIGCCIAGMASHGVMTQVEEGHGKFIGLSAMPASQSIYGFVVMMIMKGSIQAGTISALAGIGIALFCGAALLTSSVYQGKAAATAIQASAKVPALYGKCFAAVGIIESFSIFAFVFTLLIIT